LCFTKWHIVKKGSPKMHDLRWYYVTHKSTTPVTRASHVTALVTLVLAVSLADASPRVALEQDNIDLGLLQTDKVQRKVITISNRGNDSLNLDLRGSTCGCVSVEKYPKTVLAGRSEDIHLLIDPIGKQKGSQIQKLLFTTNDPARKEITITVLWRAGREDVNVSPTAIRVEVSRDDLLKSQGDSRNSIIIADFWSKRLNITNIETSTHLQTCFYDILFRCPAGGETHIFRLDTCLLPSTPVGPFNEWIRLRTNHPKFPIMTIPITGEVKGTISIEPSVLLYRDSTASGLEARRVKITTAKTDAKIKLGQTICPDRWIVAQNVSVSPQRIDIEVSLDPNALSTEEAKKRVLKSEMEISVLEPEKFSKKVEIIVIRH